MAKDGWYALGPEFLEPPREFSLCPFWFWNDDLTESELLRQMEDFQAHGVHAFVIHPRVGLPREIGWMSDRMLELLRFVVEEAAKREMWVVLYDEGMYPSGSSSGQVVATNPLYKCRGLEKRTPRPLHEGEFLLAQGDVWEVIDRSIDSVIRGLHYVDEGPEEDTPPAADLLNPDAVRCFLEKVYERYFSALGDYFGTTIKGIFTDEPALLGRPHEPDLIPGTTDILSHVTRLTGEDLSDRLDRLWEPESEERAIYDRALQRRLHETYYRPLSDWCHAHGIALMGHPEHADDLATLRYFDVPGQDLVWRWVLPGASAVEGPQSTQAKNAASAMVHQGKRRNSNECAGAYGHELTFWELKWLFDWCLVRGTNMFFPHAFYYSVRGPRKDERPPDVGPNSPWWAGFGELAKYVSRLSWLNTDCDHVCEVAIVGPEDRLPWKAAKVCFQNQIDFVYLAASEVDSWRSRYRVLISEGVADVPGEVVWEDKDQLLSRLSELGVRTLDVESHPDLRVRRVMKNGVEVAMVHNEGSDSLELALPRPFRKLDVWNLSESEPSDRLRLNAFELALLWEDR